MQPQQCLFYQENGCCNNTSKKEHIIQESLAGTLSSSKIICGACNDYFSRELDPQLAQFFYQPLHYISPLLPGRIKHKKVYVESTEESMKLQSLAGGVIQLQKIVRKYDKKGRLEKILAPTSISRDKLETIAKKEVTQYNTLRFTHAPITEGLVKPFTTFSLQLDDRIIRAVILDVLELIRYGTIKHAFPDIARHDSLRELRCWVRYGTPYFKRGQPDVPYANISDILDPLFKPSTFSHRIVASYDYNSRSLSLVAQFVNTMPWLIVIENIEVYSSSVSILYKKALIDGNDECFIKNSAVLDVKSLNWRKFSTATQDALDFSKYKFVQEYHLQSGRASYELDMRRDKELGNTLANYLDYYQNIVANPELEALLELIKSRYQLSPHINDILTLARQKALSMWSMQNTPVRQKLKCILKIYRVCLKEICENRRYGYPKVLQ
jgi:hypothetical protein